MCVVDDTEYEMVPTHRVINKSLLKVFWVNSQCALEIIHQRYITFKTSNKPHKNLTICLSMILVMQ